jgi:nitrite reductase (NADH) large subunit
MKSFWRSGHLGTLLTALLYFDVCFAIWVLNAAISPFLSEELGLSPAQKGLMMSVPVIAGALLRLPMGIVAQALGRKRSAQLQMGVIVAGLLAGWLLVDSFGGVLVMGVLLGVAGASFGVALSLGAGWYPPEHRGLAMGIAGAGNSGAVFALLFAPPLAEAFGWRAVYGVAVLPVLLTMVMLQILAREPPDRVEKKLRDYARLLVDRDAWILNLVYMVTFGGYIGLTSFMPTLFHDQYGIPKAEVGTYAAGAIVAASVLRVLGGAAADRLGGPAVLVALLVVIVGAAAGAATMPTSPATMAAILVVAFAAMGAGNGAVFQLVSLRFATMTAVAGSLVGEIGALAGGFLPSAMGIAKAEAGGYGPGFAGVALLALAGMTALAAVFTVWSGTWAAASDRRGDAGAERRGRTSAPARRDGASGLVEGENMASPGSRLVIVGNGMVSVRLCEALADRAGGRFDITVIGEEARAAYDRVKLSSYFETRDADALSLADPAWYQERGVSLRLGERVVSIDRVGRRVRTSSGAEVAYDELVLATGSAPFVPPIDGVAQRGVFVYRTIDDLEAIIAYAGVARSCAILGGGLLGLEAARAALDLGLATHVIEMAPRLMPRQLDAAGSRLLENAIARLGVTLHLGRTPQALTGGGTVDGIRFGDGETLAFDMVIVSAGIRPRDELARDAGLEVAARGGVVVDDQLATDDPHISAIGEVASHRGVCHGLVAPGYAMADVLARRLSGDPGARFGGADGSTKLKLLGVEVASFGDPLAVGDDVRDVVLHDLVRGVYHKLVVNADGSRLVGGMFVGDASPWARLAGLARSSAPLAAPPHQLLMGASHGTGAALATDASICTCHDVTVGVICAAIRKGGLGTVDDVKRCTRAGTGCGGCTPDLTRLLHAELAARGASVKTGLCEHFDYTRQELYEIVASLGIRDFDALLAARGRGEGCEICKPVAASLFASVHNEMILDRHSAIQDTNDRFLANMQRRGLYSVVPRIPGGEITPDGLITIGEIARRYGLYVKITGGQRIDLFGARLEQLPDIWEKLVTAGFESGHAYGKAMRTVKSCVGSTWCRFGVQDSVGLAIRIEHRYKGIRAPHKLKAAVSGCVRECAEAQSKDFGVIATENGYNLYVCGNGGSRPRHADLLAADLDEAALVRLIDRFLIFYIRTADRLSRTSVWLGQLEGGLEHLRDVLVRDTLGICADLERQMQALVDTYQCEWAAVVRDPNKRAKFRAFANSDATDDTIEWVSERGQTRPADWAKGTAEALVPIRRHLPVLQTHWVEVAHLADVPRGGGVAVRHGDVQLAVFRSGKGGALYATQNMCPHKHDMVLSRGLVGDAKGEPKVACPQHKKTFSLRTGACLSGDVPALRTFAVRVEGDRVLVELPPAEALADLRASRATCGHESVACGREERGSERSDAQSSAHDEATRARSASRAEQARVEVS